MSPSSLLPPILGSHVSPFLKFVKAGLQHQASLTRGSLVNLVVLLIGLVVLASSVLLKCVLPLDILLSPCPCVSSSGSSPYIPVN